MGRNEIEAITSEIRAAMQQQAAPIDVLYIAREEGILLAPGNYGEEFNGRIEYHRELGKFILFYPDIEESRYISRVRFSISHELGHYYLPEHRKLLIQGKPHNSKAGFICDNKLEREADFFAASLLLPEKVLREFCSRREFYTLRELIELANLWQTSITSAVIRYVQWTSECCSTVLSQDKKILFYLPSEEAAYCGFQWLGRKEVAPRSATIKACNNQGSGEVFEQESNSEMWFSDRRASYKLWEEAFPLGYTGLILTMLTFEVLDND